MSFQTNNNLIPQPDIQSISDLDDEARKNLLGFFALLIKVDKRINPYIYKNEYNENTNNTNKCPELPGGTGKHSYHPTNKKASESIERAIFGKVE